MSIDTRFDAICDHTIYQEELPIESDMRSILIPRVISNTDVKLYINGYKILKNNLKNFWSVEEDPTATYTKRSKIIFRNLRRTASDFYQVTYQVIREVCPKCHGLTMMNDESYAPNGLVNMVENEDKLLQEVKKGITTTLGSNIFHRWIGTKIREVISTKLTNITLLKAKLTQEIISYLQKYLEVQTQQSLYQIVTNREAFHRVLSVEINPNDVDMSLWTLIVIFKNKTGEDFLFEKPINVSGPPNILYGKL